MTRAALRGVSAALAVVQYVALTFALLDAGMWLGDRFAP